MMTQPPHTLVCNDTNGPSRIGFASRLVSAGVVTLLFASCGGGTGGEAVDASVATPVARVSLHHLALATTSTTSSIRVKIGETDFGSIQHLGNAPERDVPLRQASGQLPRLQVFSELSQTALIDASVSLDAGKQYTLAVVGDLQSDNLGRAASVAVGLRNTESLPPGIARVRVLNASPSLGLVDIHVGRPNEEERIVSGLAFRAFSIYFDVDLTLRPWSPVTQLNPDADAPSRLVITRSGTPVSEDVTANVHVLDLSAIHWSMGGVFTIALARQLDGARAVVKIRE